MVGQIEVIFEEPGLQLDGKGLAIGDKVRVLISDEHGNPEWIETQVAYDYTVGWHFVGLWGFQVVGLFAERV